MKLHKKDKIKNTTTFNHYFSVYIAKDPSFLFIIFYKINRFLMGMFVEVKEEMLTMLAIEC